MDNVVQLDPQLTGWYKKLKNVAATHLNMVVNEGEVPEGEHVKTRKNYQRLVNEVTVNEDYEVANQIHWLLGLMIEVYCHQKKPKLKLHLNDLNFIGDQLWYKYGGDQLRNNKPKNEYIANKVLTKFVTMLDES